MPNTEIDRLNQIEQYRLFQYGSNLLDCIKLKLFSLFGNDILGSFFENEAYTINMILDLQKRIKILEDENSKLKKSIDKDSTV